jgi:hypothetical protein
MDYFLQGFSISLRCYCGYMFLVSHHLVGRFQAHNVKITGLSGAFYCWNLAWCPPSSCHYSSKYPVST